MSDVSVVSRDQFRYAGEHASAQPIDGDVAEESLHHVQPRCRGGREVHDEARMLGQPLLNRRMLVRGIVVGDQMQRLVLWRLAVDLAQELQPLDMSVSRLALANDFAIEDVERGEQRGRAVALVVVRHRGRAPLLHRQPGVRAIQRLHLAHVVDAQHQRVLRRRHVQAHEVFELLHKLRIARDLEAAHQMRFQAVLAPVARDAGCTHTQFDGHRARAPVRGRLGRALGSQIHQARHVDSRWRRTARQVALNARKPRFGIAFAPARNLHSPDLQLGGNVLALAPLRGQQHDACALCQPDAGQFGANQFGQLGSFLVRQNNLGGNSH